MTPSTRLISLVLAALLSALTTSTGHAAFSDFEQLAPVYPFGNRGLPYSRVYAWDGSPVPPTGAPAGTEYLPDEAGVFTYDLESHPGSTNHTEIRLLENEISMSWDHHLVPSDATGRSYAGSTLEMKFTVSERVDVVLDGYMAGPTNAFSMMTEIDYGFVSIFLNRITLRRGSDYPIDFYETSLTGPAVQYNVAPEGRPEFLQPGHVQRGAPPTTLLPGTHWLTLRVDNSFWTTPSNSPSGDFSGWMRLRVVPEPTTALLLGLGLIGLSRGRPCRSRSGGAQSA